jgi:glycosyltransferase involved in cell wall biosynthesis
MEAGDHISVCICTYKRPRLLASLLEKLEEQETQGLFLFSIVVVDNDAARSAAETVEAFARRSKTPVGYFVEPEQNIALARNKAVEMADGDFVAFIDDDEFPSPHWLLHLYRSLKKHGADGVLGPVKPCFTASPPPWVIEGRFCERRSFATGTVMKSARDTRTGNVLFKKDILSPQEPPFDPRFGRTGGEDVDFFRKMMARNKVFVWCEEGSVHEVVPPERLKRSYFLRRALLRGVANAEGISLLSFPFFKSVVAICTYVPMLAVLCLGKDATFMKYLVKCCDHIGKILAICGWKVVRERTT